MPADDSDRVLTLAELAGYLHLGQKTVLKLAQNKKIPGKLIEKEWRFRRGAIDSWLESQNEGESDRFEEVPDGMMLPLGDILMDAGIVHDMHARDPLGAIEELAARAYSNKWLGDKPWFVGAVVEREVLASTAMEGGVAFLHTRSREASRINRPFVVVGRSYDGIDFGAPDGKPTYLFFLLGLTHDRLHLPILGRLARIMASRPNAVVRLRSANSGNKIRATLLELDAKEMQARMRAVDGTAAAGASPLASRMTSARPALDKEMRLRAIRRLSAARQEKTPSKKKGGASRAGAASRAVKGTAKGTARTTAQPAGKGKGAASGASKSKSGSAAKATASKPRTSKRR